jgi:hypothetical protein
MNFLNFASDIVSLQQTCLAQWKKDHIPLTQSDIFRLIEENHAFNYQLWHAEDRARRDDKGFEFVYHAKREIDHCNQQRNNRMEAIDAWLVEQLQPALPSVCKVNSETPGMMIDRLSILALKIYHMALQVNRSDVDETHRQTCTRKLKTLEEQRQQLTICLDNLLHDIQDKVRTFRVYHQFKMYNDPTLNPELYLKDH